MAVILALAGFAAACGGSRQAPTADSPQPTAPNLAGQSVMVLPVQSSTREISAGLDEELAFWLAEFGPAVDWTFPPELDETVGRAPWLGIEPHALAVSAFRRAEVRRIGDPLFGDLRRLGALVDARYALVPVGAAYVRSRAVAPAADSVPAADSAAAASDRPGRVEISAALIDTRGGRVLWYGVLAGERGAAGSRGVVASAAQSLALHFFPNQR